MHITQGMVAANKCDKSNRVDSLIDIFSSGLAC